MARSVARRVAKNRRSEPVPKAPRRRVRREDETPTWSSELHDGPAPSRIAASLAPAPLPNIPDDDLFECAFRHAAIGMALVGLDGRWLKVNDALCRTVGYSHAELRATDFQSITHPEDLESDLAGVGSLLGGTRDSYDLEKRYLHKNGSVVWVLLTASLVRKADGAPHFFVSQIQDITRRKQAEFEAETFFEASPDLLAIAAGSGKLEVVNAAWERALGWTKDEMTSQPFLDFVHPDDRAATLAETAAIRAGAQARGFRNRYRAKDGEYHWLEWNTHRRTEGHAERVYCAVRDVTHREQEEQARRGTKLLLDATFANIQDGVALLDADRRVVFANGTFADMFGFAPEQIVGLSREAFVTHVSNLVDDPAAFAAALMDRTAETLSPSAEFLFSLPRRRILRRTVKPVGMGNQCLNLVVWHDVTAEKDLIAEREREAMTDALTGISSRRAAEAALGLELARAERTGQSFSVALFDIDHFKCVNDVHGHLIGDEVLRRVAGVLAAQMRRTDVVARWGGEEFVAILPASVEGADVFCERVRAAVAELRCPGVGGVTLSAGVTEWKPGEDPNALVGRADELLYAAKRLGRNRVVSAAPVSRPPATE